MCLKWSGSAQLKCPGSRKIDIWGPPPSTRIKWNVDASMDPISNFSAIGGVLRDDKGVFLCVFSSPIPTMEINSAEVHAIHRAVVR